MKACSICSIWPGCWQRLSPKNHKWRTVWLLTRLLTQQTRSSAHLCVKQRAVFSSLCWRHEINGYYGRRNKGKMDDYRWWNLKLKLKWGPKTHLQLQIIVIGAAKEVVIHDCWTIYSFDFGFTTDLKGAWSYNAVKVWLNAMVLLRSERTVNRKC